MGKHHHHPHEGHRAGRAARTRRGNRVLFLYFGGFLVLVAFIGFLLWGTIPLPAPTPVPPPSTPASTHP